jgi:hypothetical protein
MGVLNEKRCKLEISCSIDSDSGFHSSSWNDTLNRIDNIYKKLMNKNRINIIYWPKF